MTELLRFVFGKRSYVHSGSEISHLQVHPILIILRNEVDTYSLLGIDLLRSKMTDIDDMRRLFMGTTPAFHSEEYFPSRSLCSMRPVIHWVLDFQVQCGRNHHL